MAESVLPKYFQSCGRLTAIDNVGSVAQAGNAVQKVGEEISGAAQNRCFSGALTKKRREGKRIRKSEGREVQITRIHPITDLLSLRSRASPRDCICIWARLTRFHLHMHPKTNCVLSRSQIGTVRLNSPSPFVFYSPIDDPFRTVNSHLLAKQNAASRVCQFYLYCCACIPGARARLVSFHRNRTPFRFVSSFLGREAKGTKCITDGT